MFKTGDSIIYNGVRGVVVYPFPVPSWNRIMREGHGDGVTVKLANMRSTTVVPASDLEKQ